MMVDYNQVLGIGVFFIVISLIFFLWGLAKKSLMKANKILLWFMIFLLIIGISMTIAGAVNI